MLFEVTREVSQASGACKDSDYGANQAGHHRCAMARPDPPSGCGTAATKTTLTTRPAPARSPSTAGTSVELLLGAAWGRVRWPSRSLDLPRRSHAGVTHSAADDDTPPEPTTCMTDSTCQSLFALARWLRTSIRPSATIPGVSGRVMDMVDLPRCSFFSCAVAASWALF